MAASCVAREQPPFECPKLPSVRIQELILKCEAIALQNGFLKAYKAKPKVCIENNLKYNVYLAENQANKPPMNKKQKSKANNNKKAKAFDPFAGPFRSGSHICDLGEKNEYKLILNKFPVLPNHILIISSDWIQQTNPLNINDFDVTLKIFQSISTHKANQNNSLIFMNSGMLSGATQMHRHLHIIPCPQTLSLHKIAKSLQKNPIESEEKKENDNNAILIFDGYPFLHGMILLDENIDCDQLNSFYHKLIAWIKNRMLLDDTIGNNYLSQHMFSYNLLITQHAMMIVVRKCGEFEGELIDKHNQNIKVKFSINALPFAGLVFCNSENQMKLLNEIGITTMIRHCTFPLH